MPHAAPAPSRRDIYAFGIGAAVLLIGVATLTPGIGTNSAAGARGCLPCGDRWLTDVISNVALFVPLGLFVALWRRSFLTALAAGVALSAGVEVLQLLGIPPGRSAVVSDVAANSTGAGIGALLVLSWAWFARPDAARGRWLALVWSVAGGTVLFGTAYLLSAPGAVAPVISGVGDVAALRDSPFPHVPHFAWYEDVLDSVVVNEQVSRRGWPGPVILQAGRTPDSITAQAFIRGRDPTSGMVPVLFVHPPSDSAPLLLLGEHDAAAELRVARRAWYLGLGAVTLHLPDVFAPRRTGDDVRTTIGAWLTPRSVSLSYSTPSDSTRSDSTPSDSTPSVETVSDDGHAGRADAVTVMLRPTLGWSLVQSVIPLVSPLAPVMQIAWLVLLAWPIGWWAGAGRRSAQTHAASARGSWWVLAIGGAVLLTAGHVGALLFHTASLGFAHTGVLVVSAISGLVAGAQR